MHAEHYEEAGYVILDRAFSPDEIEDMNAECARLLADKAPGTVFESDGETVRALHGCHLVSELFDSVVRDPRLLTFAKQVLGDDIYVHQFKINYKSAFGGDVWPWHQDTVYWVKEDGLRGQTLTNAMIFLDEVTEFNGPLYFIAGSHKEGLLDGTDHLFSYDADNKDHWTAGFGADLKYTLSHDTVQRLVRNGELVCPKGPVGTVLFFDGNTVHGSSHNMSPYGRRMLIITYNRCSNAPADISKRPAFVAARDYAAL